MCSARFSKENLSLTQPGALGWLNLKPALTQTELAKHLLLGKPATGDLVDYLEQHALVVRQPHPKDRRTKVIVMTPQGTKVMKNLGVVSGKLREELSQGISKKEVEQFMQTLDKMKNNLELMEGRID